MPSALHILNQEIVACTLCERLTLYREKVGREKRRAYMDQEYWAKPVPGFGDPNARVLILGLAPGAHGSNRTGRVFTGDGSGYFMYPVLYRTGFASQPDSSHVKDGMRLHDAYITAAVHCAPPANKPLPLEISTCAQFLDRELELLKNVRVVVALGKIGFDAYLDHLKRRGLIASRAPYVFAHSRHYAMPDGRILLASFHPSLQNTSTGRLTEAMFTDIFRLARKLIDTGGAGPASPAKPSPAQRSKADDRPDRGSSPPTHGRSRRAARS